MRTQKVNSVSQELVARSFCKGLMEADVLFDGQPATLKQAFLLTDDLLELRDRFWRSVHGRKPRAFSFNNPANVQQINDVLKAIAPEQFQDFFRGAAHLVILSGLLQHADPTGLDGASLPGDLAQEVLA